MTTARLSVNTVNPISILFSSLFSLSLLSSLLFLLLYGLFQTTFSFSNLLHAERKKRRGKSCRRRRWSTISPQTHWDATLPIRLPRVCLPSIVVLSNRKWPLGDAVSRSTSLPRSIRCISECIQRNLRGYNDAKPIWAVSSSVCRNQANIDQVNDRIICIPFHNAMRRISRWHHLIKFTSAGWDRWVNLFASISFHARFSSALDSWFYFWRPSIERTRQR